MARLNTTKSRASGRVAFCVSIGARSNLLYKRIVISAASPCGKVADDFGAAPGGFLLPSRSGSREEAGRPSAQTGHDSAKYRAEEEIRR